MHGKQFVRKLHEIHKQCPSQGHVMVSHIYLVSGVTMVLMCPSLLGALQAFLQDLGRGQAPVVAFNELSAHLLQEYSTDDTRRIKEIADKHNAVWNNINNRCTSLLILLPLRTKSKVPYRAHFQIFRFHPRVQVSGPT